MSQFFSEISPLPLLPVPFTVIFEKLFQRVFWMGTLNQNFFDFF